MLSISLTPEASTVYLAYHEPYSLEQHTDLIARCTAPSCPARARATHTVLGQTLDGRDMDLLSFGSGPRKIWLIGRQHPGESMASWFFEGFLERLTDPTDSASRVLLVSYSRPHKLLLESLPVPCTYTGVVYCCATARF